MAGSSRSIVHLQAGGERSSFRDQPLCTGTCLTSLWHTWGLIVTVLPNPRRKKLSSERLSDILRWLGRQWGARPGLRLGRSDSGSVLVSRWVLASQTQNVPECWSSWHCCHYTSATCQEPLQCLSAGHPEGNPTDPLSEWSFPHKEEDRDSKQT